MNRNLPVFCFVTALALLFPATIFPQVNFEVIETNLTNESNKDGDKSNAVEIEVVTGDSFHNQLAWVLANPLSTVEESQILSLKQYLESYGIDTYLFPHSSVLFFNNEQTDDIVDLTFNLSIIIEKLDKFLYLNKELLSQLGAKRNAGQISIIYRVHDMLTPSGMLLSEKTVPISTKFFEAYHELITIDRKSKAITDLVLTDDETLWREWSNEHRFKDFMMPYSSILAIPVDFDNAIWQAWQKIANKQHLSRWPSKPEYHSEDWTDWINTAIADIARLSTTKQSMLWKEWADSVLFEK